MPASPTCAKASTSRCRSRLTRATKRRRSCARWPTPCSPIRSSRATGSNPEDLVMTFAVVVFPGSNCDHDAYHAVKHVLGQPTHFLWHKDTSLQGADVVILPGGFSYGDYLRTGAVARFSPVMKAVSAFAAQGGPVLGICNGFQVLTEAG